MTGKWKKNQICEKKKYKMEWNEPHQPCASQIGLAEMASTTQPFSYGSTNKYIGQTHQNRTFTEKLLELKPID